MGSKGTAGGFCRIDKLTIAFSHSPMLSDNEN
ncbi:MAG: hypothetical protein ACI956_001890 [Nonlabens sp.]